MRVIRISRSYRCLAGVVLPALSLVSIAPAAHAASPVDKLQEFPLDQVQVTDTYQKGLFAKEVQYIATTLDVDRLLAGFKAMSQGTNPTNLYGGWENSLIRGHTMGHWLSAMAHAYHQTKTSDPTLNAQIKTKLDYAITQLKAYQQSNGFLFATPVDQFGAPEGQNVSSWVPWYTMHKILAGLVDVASHEANADALTVASKLGDWIYTRASGWDSATRTRVLGMEYGGMNDALYELYKLTNKANHLTAAHIFDETNIFTSVAGGSDILNGRHANTTIPKFIGALNRYRTLGTAEQSYFTAADQFLSIVLKSHTYITGGNSENEFFHAPGSLNQYRDNVNNETCNAYNMSKLTRDLFINTADGKYADFYERIHINEILSSINPETGMTTYFKAMGTGYFKVFGSQTNHFWCCTGTGMENFTRLNDSVYFHDAKDLWVTYYVTSTVNWTERGLSLTQTTDLPLTNKVTLTVNSAPTDAVSIKFRKPYWASTCQVGITVNGQAVTPTEASGFLSVSRTWAANDKVELTFPLFVQASRLQDNQNAVAFTYGPIVLSAGLGTASMTTEAHGVQVLKATKPSGLQETIAINSGTTVNAWLSNLQSNLVQTPGKLEFSLKNTDSDSKLLFIPHYSRYQDRYGIYWLLSGTSGGTYSPNVVCPTVGAGGNSGTGGAGGASSATGGGGGRANTGGTAGATTRGGAGGTAVTQGGNANVGGSAVSTGGTSATNRGGAGGATANLGGATANVGGSVQANGGGSIGGAAIGGTQGSGGSVSMNGGNTNVAQNGGNSTVSSSGGNGSVAVGGASSVGGASAVTNGDAGQNSSGCSCKLGGNASSGPWSLGLLIGLGLAARRRTRRFKDTR